MSVGDTDCGVAGHVASLLYVCGVSCVFEGPFAGIKIGEYFAGAATLRYAT